MTWVRTGAIAAGVVLLCAGVWYFTTTPPGKASIENKAVVLPPAPNSQQRATPTSSRETTTGSYMQEPQSGTVVSSPVPTISSERPKAVEKAKTEAAQTKAAASVAKKLAQVSPHGARSQGTGITTETYESFFEQQGIDDEKKSKVLAILAEDEKGRADIAEASRAQGLSPLQQFELTSQLAQKTSVEIGNVLGNEGANAFYEFRSAMLFLPVAEDFAARCSAQGAPLANSALSAMAVTISRHHTEDSGARAVGPEKFAEIRNQNDAAAYTEAQRVLTPAQMEIFKQFWLERPNLTNRRR